MSWTALGRCFVWPVRVDCRPMSPIVPAPHSAGLASSQFTIKKPWLAFLGNKFWVYAPDGSLVAFVKMPIFRLRAEMTLYADEAMTRPMMHLQLQKLMTVNPLFDVMDVGRNVKLGSVRKLGLKSMLRDKWELLDPSGTQVGDMEETGNSFLRRMIPLLLGTWEIRLGGAQVASIRQLFTFFAKEYVLDMSQSQGRIDPSFAIACSIFALLAESAREASS